jgi:hypothetical protein
MGDTLAGYACDGGVYCASNNFDLGRYGSAQYAFLHVRDR